MQRRKLRQTADVENERVRHRVRRNGAAACIEREIDTLHCERAFAPYGYSVLLLPTPILRLDEGDALGKRPVDPERRRQLAIVDLATVDMAIEL